MAQKHVICDLNLNGNEIKQAVIEVLASAPAGKVGKIYYDSTKSAIGYCTHVAASLEDSDVWSYVDASNVYAIDTIADNSTDIFQIYQKSSGPTASGDDMLTTFTFRALKAGTNITLTKTAITDSTSADYGKEYITVTVTPQTATDLGGDSASNNTVPSQAAVKSYVDAEILKVNTDIAGAMHFIGTWDGTKTIVQNISATGQAISKLRKGDYWVVDTACAHASIPTGGIESATGDGGLEVGDMVIAISDIADVTDPAPTASDFKVIDNTESADLLRTSNLNTSGALNANTATYNSTVPTDYTVATVLQGINAEATHYYKTVINTAVSTATVTASTHGCGLYPEVKVYQAKTVSNVTTQNEVVAQVSLNASGDVTVSWNGAITVDQGTAVDPITIVIVGKVESSS